MIDLEEVSFVPPYALVSLACLVAQAHAAGLDVVCLAPKKFEVACYLSRCSLGAVLEDHGFNNPLPSVRHHSAGGRVLELTRVLPDDGCDELATMVFDWVERETKGRATQLYWALLELGYNVEEHSGTQAYFCAQVFPGPRNIQFAFGDWGIGIRRSLANGGHEFDSDIEAIDAAVTTGLTSKTGDGGVGLPNTLKAVRRLDGQFTVRSGRSHLFWNNNRTGGDDVPGLLSGTVVGARMRLG